MRKSKSKKRIYINAILIVIIVVFGLMGIYIKIMDAAYQKNINHLTQSLIEVEQSKLKNEVNELVIKVSVDHQYMLEGYNRMLDVVDSTLHQSVNEDSQLDESLIQKLLFLTSIYKDLQIRIYDQQSEEIISEIKQNQIIPAEDVIYSDFLFDFALTRIYTFEQERYVVVVGILDSYLETVYKGMLKDQFAENPNLSLIYTLIEIDNYEGGDDFARVIQGQGMPTSCSKEGCYISTTYQDESGHYVLQEILDSLKQSGVYFGYIEKIEGQYMVYAELYQGYDLIILTSKPMKDFYQQTMAEFDVFEQNFKSQIRIAMTIACTSFIIALLGGVVTFKYLKFKTIENERERNRIITEHNKVLSRRNDQINQLAHDIKNHLICIKGFINQQTPEAASEYIDSVYEDLNQLSTIVITGNRLVDIILNDKISQMKKLGIMFTKRIERVSLDFVDFKEMTIILTNMLDNAIESCEQSKQKEIHFTMATFNETYVFMKVVNSCDVAPVISKGKLKSTKVQKGNHGYGVKNIEQAVAKYNGSTHFEYDPVKHQFTFVITLEKPQ